MLHINPHFVAFLATKHVDVLFINFLLQTSAILRGSSVLFIEDSYDLEREKIMMSTECFSRKIYYYTIRKVYIKRSCIVRMLRYYY